MLEGFVFFVFAEVGSGAAAFGRGAVLTVAAFVAGMFAAADVDAFVHPRGSIVGFFFGVPAGEETFEFFGVFELFGDDYGRVGEMDAVLAEDEVVGQDVVDEAAEENDVGAGADRHPHVGDRGGAAEARVNMNDRSALLFGFDDPLKANGMVLGHVGTHDENDVGVGEIFGRAGGTAAAECCAQTGHGGAMSYSGLVADTDHAQAGGEKFF